MKQNHKNKKVQLIQEKTNKGKLMSDKIDPIQEELNKLKKTNQDLNIENQKLKQTLNDIVELTDKVLKSEPEEQKPRGLFDRKR